MNEEESPSKSNKLERKLYSRKAPDIINADRAEFKSDTESDAEEVSTNWQAPEGSRFDMLASKISRTAERRGSFVKKFFVIAVALFVISAAGAAFVFFGGANFISSENVDIKVVGPVSIGGGQETSFDINVLNNNNTNLDSVSLLVEYPAGTRSP